MDPIQKNLRIYSNTGDPTAHARAIDGLYKEWAPLLHARCAGASTEEREDHLQQALLDLAFLNHNSQLRALCPTHPSTSIGWRRTVFLNWLRDRWRHSERHHQAEQAFRSQHRPALSRPTAELDTLLHYRQQICIALARLPVRRRVLLSLALGGEPLSLVEQLATALSEPVPHIHSRLQSALQAPHDHQHPFLSSAMVRVLYPHLPQVRALDNARKTLSRTIALVQNPSSSHHHHNPAQRPFV